MPKPIPSDPERHGAELLGGLATAFTVNAERARALSAAAIKTWTDQNQAFLDVMARDSADALAGLQRCKSPFEVLGVGQAWFLARANACGEAGLRLFCANLHDAEAAATGSSPEFRLPE